MLRAQTVYAVGGYAVPDFASPDPIGSSTPNSGEFTTLTASTSIDGPLVMGGGSGTAKTIGAAYINVTPVGNVGVGEDTMMSYSLPANSLSENGKAVRATVWGYTSSNANAKTIKFYFGTELLGAYNPVANELNYWRAEIVMTRYSAAIQAKFLNATIINNNLVSLADISVGSAAEDETAAILIKATGQGTDNDDVVQSGMIVEFIN